MSVPTLSSRILTSVQFSHSVVSNSLQPHGPQHARPPCLSPTPGVYPNSCPLSQRCRPTISSSVIPFSFCLQSFPPSGFFLVSQLFPSGGQSIGVSASTSVLPMNTQDWSPLGSPCCPRDSQESSPAPQFESINSLVLSLVYGPTLTTIHDYWESHSFSSKGQTSFNFMAAVTNHSDFGAQENKVCHCFHFSSIYLPWNDGTGCFLVTS